MLYNEIKTFAGIIKKFIWIILSLASLAFLIVHLDLMISGYLSYDVTTNINVVESRSLDFPGECWPLPTKIFYQLINMLSMLFFVSNKF